MRRFSAELSDSLNPFEVMDRRKELLKFFQISSENEIIARFPCLGETLAHNIILKRRKFPLKRLKDVWNLEDIRAQLLSDCGSVVDDSITPEPEITEFPNRAVSMIATNQLNYAPGTLPPILPPIVPPHLNPYGQTSVQIHTPSAPPPPPHLPPADNTVMELFEVLNGTGLIDRWKEYLNNDQLLNVSDSLPSNTYRLATWNLDRLSVAKAKHPGIREAICLTILAYQFDLIAFQEVVEPEAVQMLADELNSPKLPMVKRWMSVNQVKRGMFTGFSSAEKTGRTFQAAEYSSFLYRYDRMKAISSRILEIADDSGRPFSRLPFLSKFRIGSNTLVLTSVHLKAPALNESKSSKNAEEINCLTDFIDAMNDTFASEDRVYCIILGDFNLDPGNKAFDAFRSRGLISVLPTACATMASAVEKGAGIGKKTGTPLRSSPSFDNAWLCPKLVTPQSKSGSKSTPTFNGDGAKDKTTTLADLHFSGLCAVANPFRHPLIPSTDFSEESGRPSDHCPVYFDLKLRDTDS
nr:endonuclease:exonuclease:phosphatase family [Hymenolepis microstoma]